jgi:hypothetical protein
MHAEAVTDAAPFGVGDGMVDEGQAWDMVQHAGRIEHLQEMSMSSIKLNSTRRDRGLLLASLDVGDRGTQWHRSHDLLVGSRKLCAVLVRLEFNHPEKLQVMLVDGAACLTSQEQHGSFGDAHELRILKDCQAQGTYNMQLGHWALVGKILGPAIEMFPGDPTKKVSLGTCSRVQLVPLQCIAQLVGCVRSQSEPSVCMIADPNRHFLMIPLTGGVMRASATKNRRVSNRSAAAGNQFDGGDEDDWDDSNAVKEMQLPGLIEMNAYDEWDMDDGGEDADLARSAHAIPGAWGSGLGTMEPFIGDQQVQALLRLAT